MKRKAFMLVNGVLIFFITVNYSYGMRRRNIAEFKKKGYDIEVFWEQKQDTLKVWGEIDEGKKCNQLNLSIFFDNSKDSGSGHVEAAITEYNPSRFNKFKASDKVYVNPSFKNHWHVSSIYINCLD